MGYGVRVRLLMLAMFFGLGCGYGVRGQVYFSGTGADFHLLTSYRGEVAQDTIWVYYRSAGQEAPMLLEGVSHGGVSRRLVVRRWETDGWEGRYVGVDSVESGSRISYVADAPGGYEVLGIVGGDTVRRRIWVMEDDVEFTRIDVQNGCDGLRMAAEFTSDHGSIRYDKFTYYDMSQRPARELNDLGEGYFSEVVWEDGEGRVVELYGLRVSQTSPPPYESVAYRVRIKTLLGKEFSGSTGQIAPVAVKAKCRVEVNSEPELAGGKWKDAGSPARGVAPLHLRMVSESENAGELVWYVRNDARAVRQGGVDTLHYARTDSGVEFVNLPSSLFTAGDYTLVLQAGHISSGCVDTMGIRLHVDSSLLSLDAIPNAFSPNGDGVNDAFQFIERDRNVRGLRDFHLEVFNRNGQSVYEYRGDVRDWSGWNGERGGKGAKVDAGVYFYIIRAQGWDGRRYQGSEYKGVLHVFR